MIEAVSEVPQLAAPQPVYNCPECDHYLPPGTLACPDCHALAYAGFMRTLAIKATAEEDAKAWTAARATWTEALPWLPAGTKQYVAVEQRVAALDEKLRNAEQNKARWMRRLGPLAPAALYLSKAKTLLFVLLKFKFLLSFVAFFGLYWAAFGWKFAAGFTLSIAIHEMGHYVAARRRGLKVDLPVFLPGLGAYVRWYAQGMTLDALAAIALAGPFFGFLVAAVFGVLAAVTGNPLFSALAHVSAWLNIINLTPVLGLDGAQATYALDRTQRWLILATALIFFGMLHEPVFLAVAGGMGWRIFRGGFAEKANTRTLVRFVLLLFALGVVLAVFPEAQRFRRF